MNRPQFIQYDIPEVPLLDAAGQPRFRRDENGVLRRMTRPVCDNPSTDLWRAGCIRTTKSVWVAMESNLHRVYPILNNLDSFGVRWYVVPFDVSAVCTLRQMALENIRREIAEMMESAAATRQAAEVRFDAEDGRSARARRTAYLNAARSIERRITERLELVGPAAEQFGISRESLRCDEAVADVVFMADTMRRRAASFAAANGLLTRSRRDGARGMGRSLASGDVHPLVVADFLDEMGEPESAEVARGLRASFDFS